jgi:hypothetical protein
LKLLDLEFANSIPAPEGTRSAKGFPSPNVARLDSVLIKPAGPVTTQVRPSKPSDGSASIVLWTLAVLPLALVALLLVNYRQVN